MIVGALTSLKIRIITPKMIQERGFFQKAIIRPRTIKNKFQVSHIKCGLKSKPELVKQAKIEVDSVPVF